MATRISDPFLRLAQNIDVDGDTGCWNWNGATNSSGYGRMSAYAAGIYTHRFSYQACRGPIPYGLQIDHLCRNRKCCNPDHLEPVTGAENTRRGALAKTHCPAGHPYSGENLYVSARGDRQCRTCRKKSKAKFIAQRTAAH